MIKNINHFGFTVSSLEEAIYFFRDLLGLETTSIRKVEDGGLEKVIQVPVPGVSLLVSDVTLPDKGTKIELLQYDVPKGHAIDVKIWNPGVSHVAFEVDDIQETYKDLTAKGVNFKSEPHWRKTGIYSGWGGCFLEGPDGILIELKQPPIQAEK